MQTHLHTNTPKVDSAYETAWYDLTRYDSLRHANKYCRGRKYAFAGIICESGTQTYAYDASHATRWRISRSGATVRCNEQHSATQAKGSVDGAFTIMYIYRLRPLLTASCKDIVFCLPLAARRSTLVFPYRLPTLTL